MTLSVDWLSETSSCMTLCQLTPCLRQELVHDTLSDDSLSETRARAMTLCQLTRCLRQELVHDTVSVDSLSETRART